MMFVYIILIVMRKNKSLKDYSLGRTRKSQGKQISIQLQPGFAKLKSSKHLQNSQLTDRLDRSAHPISHNILKDIINYSNMSHSHVKSTKGTTLGSYDRHQDIISQLNKINKKASLGEIARRDSQKLVLDHPISNPLALRSPELMHQHTSVEMIKSQLVGKQQTISQPIKQFSSRKASLNNSVSKSQLNSWEKEKEELSARLDELQTVEDAIKDEFSEMISEWQKMIIIDQNISTETHRLTDLEIRRQTLKLQLESSNQQLLKVSRQFVDSRKRWDLKGNGARTKVLDEVMYAHNEFLRKLTVRSFEQTLVFNMKVTIPDYKGKTNIRGIYEELFHSRLTKKFIMLLKKYRNQMDLYDGELLSDFTKRVSDLEGQYSRCEGECTIHPDEPFLNKIELVVASIDDHKSSLQQTQMQRQQALSEFTRWHQLGRQCGQTQQKMIQEMNSMVKGEYQRQTQKAADFKVFLTQKYSEKYKTFKTIRMDRETKVKQLQRVNCLCDRLWGDA